MTLTIDTQVLCAADEPEDQLGPDALDLIVTIRKLGHFIAVDDARKIEGEYWSNLSGYPRQWLKRMFDTKGKAGYRIQRHNGRVPNRPKRKLLQELDFDPDDLPFVGVAYHTASKLLVAHESDYTPQVCEYLCESHLGVRVRCAADAEAECRMDR